MKLTSIMSKGIILNCIWVICLFNIIGLCSTENDADPKLSASAYEYIVENFPKKLKKIIDEVFKNGMPDQLIDFYAPISAENELCREESISYKNSFEKFEVWALKMWDSSGKLPSGILEAHFHDLGNYQECLGVSDIGPYHVKYCLIEIKNVLPTPLHHNVFNKIDTIIFGSLKIIKGNLYLARCIPASCDKDDLEKYYSSIINKYNMTVNIDKFSCTASNENEPFNGWDWAAVFFSVVTVILLILSTVTQFVSSKNEKRGVLMNVLLCFSCSSNIKQIFTTENTQSELSFIQGLRAIGMILIILGHMAVRFVPFPRINYLQLVKEYSKPSVIFACLSTYNLAVDVFFVISGFLISYIQMKILSAGRKFNYKLYYIRRFFRIVPSYAGQMLLYCTIVYRYFGSGPLWKMFANGFMRENCFKNWWKNLLFINNYVNQNESCIPSNWFLAVDMQLYIIAPFILFLMIKLKSFLNNTLAILILIIMCDGWVFYDSYKNNYKAGPVVDIIDFRTEEANQFLYATTHSRFSKWLLGFYLGYVLENIDKRPKKKILSKVILWIGWSFSVLLQALAVYSSYYFISKLGHNNFIDSLYNSVHRTIFALSVCWLIFTCKLGYGGFINDILNWYPLQVLGRLSFAAYMTQLIVVMGIDGITQTSLQYHPFMVVREVIGDIIICYIFAFFNSLLFELPYINLGRLLTLGLEEGIPLLKENKKATNIRKDLKQNYKKD